MRKLFALLALLIFPALAVAQDDFSKVEIKAHAFTASAKKAIEDKGGNATEIK